MTIDQFMEKAVPIIAPLPHDQNVLAIGHMLEALRGKSYVSKALAERLLEELRQRSWARN
jgi:hypothetical protein